ncbi:heterokaryon incompatibility protein-domain-containing protein [Xylaria sp. FL0933]|nr:heterokaryon incompatibility protein-domain-containing protein [Xylaria sp. FL0933]
MTQLESRTNVSPLPPIQASRTQLYDSLPVTASERTIRILDLESPNEPSGVGFQLIGRLRVVSLKTSPRISALSYVWGAFSQPTPDVLRVRLDNSAHVDLDITTNCAAALKQLVSRFGSMSIWVDAICINQVDDVEKSSQVLLMEEIFSWAKVYVWLGSESDASKRIFERFSHLSENGRTDHFLTVVAFASAATVAKRKEAASRLLHDILKRDLHETWVAKMHPAAIAAVLLFRFLLFPIWEVLSYPIKALIPRSVTAEHTWSCSICSSDGKNFRGYVDEILRRPWFYRGWTFQEFALPMEITLLCGPDDIGWDAFVRGLYHDGNALAGLESVNNFYDTLNVWVCLPRKVSWNGLRMRRNVGREDPTIKHYQSIGLKLLKSSAWSICFFLILSLKDGRSYNRINLGALAFVVVLSTVPIILGEDALPVVLVTIILVKVSFFLWSYIIHVPSELNLSRNCFTAISQVGPDRSQVKPSQGILYAMQTRETSDPRDRAYASYAILSSLGVKLTPPDYSKDVGSVYQEHFINLLHWNPGFLNLIIDVDGETLPGSASWVPNWHTRLKPSWIGSPRIYEHSNGNETDITVESSNESICLIVSGQLIGRSQQQMRPFPRLERSVNNSFDSLEPQLSKQEEEDLLITASNFAEWIDQIHHNATMRYKVSTPLIVAFVLGLQYKDGQFPEHITSTADIDSSSFDSSIRDGRFESCYRRLKEIPVSVLESSRTGNSRQLSANLVRQYVFPSVGTDSDENTMTASQLRLLNNLIAGKRSLIITNNGLVGCWPERMRSNDQIFWISGVSVPMVLRPRSDLNGENSGYTVVGPAFIYDCERPTEMSSQLRLY